MPSRKLTEEELDILDGFDIPNINPSVNPIETRYDEALADVSKKTDPESIITSIRDILQQYTTFDGLTNTSSTRAGVLGSTSEAPSDEEVNALIQHARERIQSVRDKAAQIKEAVRVRQKADPTELSFNPKEHSLLKQGLVRIFGHKANTVTFEQYQAALDARSELSNKKFSEQTADIKKVLK